ncbi:Pnap_2097 family protein [Mycolicibacterium phocaicum]|uniref:Pnap_2097 family protein n=1 Tax=Mycolicibacterium phocaicum TaxID=319706 RepID=UPI001CF9BB0F|nr:Pnap_2097 family protein [Mycolicibacterium phocaicum]UCZ60901.1 hypothetical protein LHJ73_01275 [Mycolicibacterium phocaicum]
MNRTVKVGMPQMALGCLSENWLLKELGDLHWDTLCSSLKSTSRDLVDSQGRRLYATFVRIRIDLDGTLRDFGEGDEITFRAEMMRFGRSTVQSTIAIQGPKSSGTARLLTTFSVRTRADSNALLKSEPMGDYCGIEAASDISPFFKEYSAVRAEFGRYTGDLRPGPEDTYQINPFVDSNGANLLYFAAYQSISDLLTLRSHPEETNVSTSSRDIYFFRNTDLGDTVYRQPVARSLRGSGSVDSAHLLIRSDGQCLAYVNTVKEP